MMCWKSVRNNLYKISDYCEFKMGLNGEKLMKITLNPTPVL